MSISAGCFIRSVPVYLPPKLSLTDKIIDSAASNESMDSRPSSASMSYIPRHKHLRNASQRPESASHLRLSSKTGSIHIERRMIWNDEVFGMVVDVMRVSEWHERSRHEEGFEIHMPEHLKQFATVGEIAIVRVYLRGETLLTERPLEAWPLSHLKPISRTEFASRTKIPFIQQKWIPKEVRDMFMMSKREKRRLELSLAVASGTTRRKRPSTASSRLGAETSMSREGNSSVLSSVLNNPYNAPESYKLQQLRNQRPSSSPAAARRSVSSQRRHSSRTSQDAHSNALMSPPSSRKFPTLPLSTIHMPIHTTTTEDDIEYLYKIIQQRKHDMAQGKLGSSFMDPELVEDKRVKKINRNSSTALAIANEVPDVKLTRLHESIRQEQRLGVPLRRTVVEEHVDLAEDSDSEHATPRSGLHHNNPIASPRRVQQKRGSSRFDRLLHTTRDLSMSQLQSDFDARKVSIRKELERDGVVLFGQSTNYEHFFKAKLIDVLYSESKSAIVLKVKTKGLVHDCLLDGVEVQPNMFADVHAVVWRLVKERRKQQEMRDLRGEEDVSPRHDIVYFPVKSSTDGQLCIDVFVQLQWLQCVLLHYGLAKIRNNQQNKLGIERLMDHQTTAMDKKLGVWQYHITKRHSSHVEEGISAGRAHSGITGAQRRHSQMPRTIRRVSVGEVSILDSL